MKRHRHTPEQIVRELREGERLLNEGKDITEVVRHLEIAERTWNRRRSQYGGMTSDQARRLRQLETENARLKKLLAEAELDKSMLKSWPREPSDSGAQRRAVVMLVDRFGVSERRACGVVGQNRRADWRPSRSVSATCSVERRRAKTSPHGWRPEGAGTSPRKW
jgi:putative transposase